MLFTKIKFIEVDIVGSATQRIERRVARNRIFSVWGVGFFRFLVVTGFYVDQSQLFSSQSPNFVVFLGGFGNGHLYFKYDEVFSKLTEFEEIQHANFI